MENMGNVFSERPEAVKCLNFLSGHFVFFKCGEFCTEAIEMPVANTVGRYFSVAYNFHEFRKFVAKSRKLKSRN